jgi:hypothetical protein
VGLGHQARLHTSERLEKPSLCYSVCEKHLLLCWHRDASGLGKE